MTTEMIEAAITRHGAFAVLQAAEIRLLADTSLQVVGLPDCDGDALEALAETAFMALSEAEQDALILSAEAALYNALHTAYTFNAQQEDWEHGEETANETKAETPDTQTSN